MTRNRDDNLPDVPPGLEFLMTAFIAEMAQDLDTLLACMAGGHRGRAAEHIHGMRGKCAMFGESRLHDLLARLERELDVKMNEENCELITQVIERVRQLKI